MVSMSDQPINWKVQWKFPKMKAETAQYVAGNIYDLMRMLHRSENVNRETVEFLIVHQMMADGSVVEHMAVDNYKKGLESANVISNVTSMLDRVRQRTPEKPRIVVTNEPKAVVHRPGRVVMGLNYVAYPARSKEQVA